MRTTATSVGGSLPSTRGREAAVVGELHDDLVRAGDDVVVGQDDAAAVDDEPRAQAFLLLAPAAAAPAAPNCSRSIRVHGSSTATGG